MQRSVSIDFLWHQTLLIKLMDIGLLWYMNLKALVRWEGVSSHLFNVSIGALDEEASSPTIFYISLNDLLVEPSQSTDGIRVGDALLNSYAYADDVSLTCMCSPFPSLQRLINVCCEYAKTWH